MILILSSHVASSPVGGTAQVRALAALDYETVHIPTVLFGRHPGLGPPGGGAVDPMLFAGMIEGVEANGVVASCEAVIAGYFADPAQVEAAAVLLSTLRASRPTALVVIDPIMGDTGKGLYVKPAVAEALARLLVPQADILTPNAWELECLTGHTVTDPASALAAARTLGRPVLATSVPVDDEIGVLWSAKDGAWLATHRRAANVPNGTGDLLTALFTAAILGGATGPDALETAVEDVLTQAVGLDTAVRIEALG